FFHLSHQLCYGSAGARETSKYLLRRSECEIVQHQNDFLPVFAQLISGANDKRRRHKVLLLHLVMRVHPIGARDRSIVIGLNRAIRDWRRLRPRKAILSPWRELPMPMNERVRAGFIGKLHLKSLACGEANSGNSVWTRKPEDLGRSAIHLEHACSGDKALWRKRQPARHARQYRQHTSGECTVQKSTARERRAHDFITLLSR